MRLRNLTYFFREALKSLFKNRILSLATVSTVAICILILGVAVLLSVNANKFMGQLESDVEIIAYLENSISTSTEISRVSSQLERIDGIKEVVFVSKDEGLDYLQERVGRDGFDLVGTLQENPLPDSFHIQAKDPHGVPDLAIKISSMTAIEKVNYGQGVVERLFSVTNWVRTISTAIIILLAFGAVFLIATTIRLAIYARRKEIYLMKLIGATDWFIRWPFFIEGILLGLFGSLLAIAILATGYGALISNVNTAMLFIPLMTDPSELLAMYAALVGAGVLLGILGTTISINRFMDV
ncbi:Cell-division-associated, ABC-transporter-like signaling protein FtsX [Candidatus Syntrophocurvum alkaliphilum]|uniref:Cell division protein FtsX n=1 Tax=Candidatus Syntrophocurvum alkaliphilum TaxID=2293317 RepID=A0A6I6DCQ8_9FIRM|nr:permease-like cell division protein FtsX [Candidatus Syntrophocurvum alkaliphilum]QGU00382.1 Cell-division-associated, ABC-transporter-like signaling protein FtsX [Candidatus Syntrophocurvum alkaliphilum]